MKLSLAIITLLSCLAGCSSFNQMAVNSSAGMIMESSNQSLEEGNWDVFKESSLSNIKLLEGLLHVSPSNPKLLSTLVKAHSGLAFGHWETELLREQLKENEGELYKKRAIYHYNRARILGLKFFAEQELSWDELVRSIGQGGKLGDLLSSKLDDDVLTHETALFFAQALGGMLNLQQERIELVAYLPLVKGLYDWVCQARPEIHFGTCDLFYGAYYSIRPKFLGGDPEKGQKHFLKAIARYPSNALARIAYIQYYLLPRYDQKSYAVQKKALQEIQKDFKVLSNWYPKVSTPKSLDNKKMRLFQAIGLKRFEIISSLENEIF